MKLFWSATSVACIAIHCAAFARPSKRRRSSFCFCVCTFWEKTSMNDNLWSVWFLSEYTITYRSRRSARNLSYRRINVTESECTQQFASSTSTTFDVCILFYAKPVACRMSQSYENSWRQNSLLVRNHKIYTDNEFSSNDMFWRSLMLRAIK